MFYVRNEGQKIKPGIGFYPLSNETCFGFVLSFGSKRWNVRLDKRKGIKSLRVRDWSIDRR